MGKVGIFMTMSDEKGIKWKKSCSMDCEERSADSGACSKGFSTVYWETEFSLG